MLRGEAALQHLANSVNEDDPAASSHWRLHHSNLRFEGDGFSGLQGFGGTEAPPRGLRRMLHSMFQRPYRRMGRAWPYFQALDALASGITRRQNRAYDLDVLRQALTLAYLRHRVPEAFGPRNTSCVIGDGFASMTSLLLASGSARQVVLVNLSKTLLVDLWYLRLWMGTERFDDGVGLVLDGGPATWNGKGEGLEVVAVEARNHESIRAYPLDSAVNIVSMQEMDPPVISAYFADLRAIATRRNLLFYCCNREEKTLPDGTVTRFADYPWHVADRVLVDELCPWHQRYYSFRPPFQRRFDGPIRHRVSILAGITESPE